MEDPLSKKLSFLSNMAIAWVSSFELASSVQAIALPSKEIRVMGRQLTKFALMQLIASIFTGPTLAQTAMEDGKPRLLEETKTPSGHTCKFEFINRSAVPIYVITV